MMNKRKQFIFISLGLVALATGLITGIPRTKFVTSVVDLLPDGRTEFKILRELAEQDQGRLITVRIFTENTTVPPAIGRVFLEALQQDPNIEKVWLANHNALSEAGVFLFNHRYQWLLPHWLEQNFPNWGEDRSIDSNELATRVIEEMDRYLASPRGTTLVETIPQDPFILMEQVLNSTALLNAPLEKKDLTFWVRQRASPFVEAGQEPVFESLDAAFQATHKLIPNLQMEYSGVSCFAAASKVAIQGEVQRLNLLGLLLILALTTYYVRSFKTTLHIFLVAAIALATAATTVILIFSSVHIISLVIGSILTGIAVDYAFHLLLREDRGLDKQTVTRAVVTGSMSSALGFFILLWAPLPFLQQVGTFVGSGLIAALMVSLLLRTQKGQIVPKKAWRINPFSLPAWTGPFLVFICMPGLNFIEWKDQINDLEYPLPELKSKDQRLRWQSQGEGQKSVHLVYGNSLMEARERLRQLHFDTEHTQLLHLGTWIPDLVKVQSTQQYFTGKTGFTAALRRHMEARGYYCEEFGAFFQSWENYLQSDVSKSAYIREMAEFSTTLPGPLATLLHKGEQTSWFMILGPSSFQPDNADGLILLDQANILSSAFTTYRETVIIFSGFCLLGLSVVVLSIYGLARGAAALALPAIAIPLAFGLLGYVGASFSLIHVIGALLAFCISLDYALFAVVAHQKHYRLPSSVCISATTTIGAFAILATSSIPAIQQLSVSILLIIAMSLLLIIAGWPFIQRGAVPGRWCFRLLPHGQEAYFIKQVETLSKSSIETVCEPHLEKHFEAEWTLEAMAQSAAVLLAYKNGNRGQPRSGMIVIIQQFKLPSNLGTLVTPLSCKVKLVTDAQEGLMLFEGTCYHDEIVTVAKADFSIFIPPIESLEQS